MWCFIGALWYLGGMIHVVYRSKFATQAIFRVKMALCLAIIKYMKQNDLDKAVIHKQALIHYNAIPKRILISWDQLTPLIDVPQEHHAYHKAPTKKVQILLKFDQHHNNIHDNVSFVDK